MTTANAPHESPDEFRTEVIHHGRRTLIAVRGDLDLATAPQLERTLSDEAHYGGLVVVDLRELTFIDVSGLRVLLRADAYSRREGMQFQLIPGGATTRLLELCGLRARFVLANSPDD